VPERFVVELRQRVTGEHRRRVEPDGLGEMAGHKPVVARDDLHFDMQLREVAEHARGVGLGRVEKSRKPAKTMPVSSSR
jgi:hypothetical protein